MVLNMLPELRRDNRNDKIFNSFMIDMKTDMKVLRHERVKQSRSLAVISFICYLYLFLSKKLLSYYELKLEHGQ